MTMMIRDLSASRQWRSGLVLLLLVVIIHGCGAGAPSSDETDVAEDEPAPTAEETAPESSETVDPGDEVAPRVTLAVPDAQIEFHGRLRDAPLWVRLYPRDESIGGRRLLALSYAQPDQEETDGVVLADHPELLVDDVLRIYQWSEGGGSISGLLYRGSERGYEVVHERERDEGDQRVPYEKELQVAGPAAWDLRLAPVLLALIWQPQTSSPVIPLRDFFGPRAGVPLTLQWQGDQVRIGDQEYRIDADAEGRLAALRDHRGSIVLEVDGWRPLLEPAAAQLQAQERQRRLEDYLDRPSDADHVDLQEKLDTGRMEVIDVDE